MRGRERERERVKKEGRVRVIVQKLRWGKGGRGMMVISDRVIVCQRAEGERTVQVLRC